MTRMMCSAFLHGRGPSQQRRDLVRIVDFSSAANSKWQRLPAIHTHHHQQHRATAPGRAPGHKCCCTMGQLNALRVRYRIAVTAAAREEDEE